MSKTISVEAQEFVSSPKLRLGVLVLAGTLVPAALLYGAGASATPETTSLADKNFLGQWTESTAATGDSRGAYIRHFFAGAGSGEALRAYATVSYAGAAAVGGTINGMHCSLSVNAGSSISGQAHAARFTLDYAAAVRTMDANVNCLLVESNLATGNTPHANNAFIRVTDTGAVALGKLFRLPTTGSGLLVAPHVTQVMTDSIRIVMDDGSVRYIMCTTSSANRTGGA